MLFFPFIHRPHFKPLSDILEDSDTSPNTPVKKFINSRFRRESTDSSVLQSSPRLYRSFSTQPTSKFRVNPYPTNGVCVNNQAFLSSLTSNLVRVQDVLSNSQKLNTNFSIDGPKAAWTNNQTENSNGLQQSLIRSHSSSSGHGFVSSTKLSSSSNDQQQETGNSNQSSVHGQNATSLVGLSSNTNPSLIQPHATPSNRLPPTGPSSAVFQLNFPILKSKSPGTSPAKGLLNRRLSNSNESNKDHRNGHKRNNTITLKNGVPNIPQAHFRQAMSAVAGTNQSLNVTR